LPKLWFRSVKSVGLAAGFGGYFPLLTNISLTESLKNLNLLKNFTYGPEIVKIEKYVLQLGSVKVEAIFRAM
jgi:hypothetical protein